MKRITGKIIQLLLSPLYALVSTRPKRECAKAIFFAFPGSGMLWRRKWNQWQVSRVWLDPTQKQRLFRWYPFFVRGTYTLTYPGPVTHGEKPSHAYNTQCNAIVIHVFYPDVFGHMLRILQSNGAAAYPIYLTFRPEIQTAVEEILHRQNQKATLHVMENRGRDIAPFLSLLPVLRDDGVTHVLKLHTKKSIHLGDAEHTWLADILFTLVENRAMDRHFQQLHTHTHIGMIAPYGHVIPMAFYYGDNTEKLLDLVKKWNIPPSLLGSAFFVAGSMFYIRLASIQALASEPDILPQFEEEIGQTDGTLAHAMERVFTLLVQSSHYCVTDTNGTEDMPSLTVFSDHVYSR